MALLRTSILILSDTHGLKLDPSNRPALSADVAIHCGDLTDGSKLEEFSNAIELLKQCNAPLKLVIAGNHDFSMDIPAFNEKISEANFVEPLDPVLVAREYGAPGRARELFDAAGHGITFLDEGVHDFRLENAAALRVFASPYTPSTGGWGFPYNPDQGHQFSIDSSVDVVITHGPPLGIMDKNHEGKRAGCKDLFTAIAQARPRLHCFGHIHEGWGAKLATWRPKSTNPNHFSAIFHDKEKSPVIETLPKLLPSDHESSDERKERIQRVQRYEQDRCCSTSHCRQDDHPLTKDQQTLFVNAALCDRNGVLGQKAWLIDIELPEAKQ